MNLVPKCRYIAFIACFHQPDSLHSGITLESLSKMHFLKFLSGYQCLFLLFYVIDITLIQFSYLNSDISHDDPQSWLQKKLC